MSNADRQKRYRARKRNAQQAESVTRVTEDGRYSVTVTREQEQAMADALLGIYPYASLIGPDVYYHPRTHPERINWGERMSADQLKAAGLVANSVAIPGDSDYQGVYQC